MNGRRGTRRGFLGALVGGIAMIGAGRLGGVLAEPIKTDMGFGSKAAFKKNCDELKGEFIDSPKDKLTLCVYPDGAKHVCDTKGNNCTQTPPPDSSPNVGGGGQNPFGGILGDIAELPEVVPAEPAVGNSADFGADESAPAKRRRRGKRRKK